jgi:release factor glutamine methyltransferase
LRIEDALTWATFLLAGTDSPELDARVLLAHVLGKETIYLMTWPERDISREHKADFEDLVQKRINGIPVAHLTGVREFWSLPLKVNDSTLIPRPDTEILVESALEFSPLCADILDMGTGTGAVILALASELPQANCVGIDISPDAIKLAIENSECLKITNVEFKQSNWFENVTGQFDLIVSNPPYIDKQDHHLKQGDVRFEPLSALVADNQGLADIELIADQAIHYLKVGGALMIEHGFDQAESVRGILNNIGYSETKTIKDYGGNDRVTLAIYNKNKY